MKVKNLPSPAIQRAILETLIFRIYERVPEELIRKAYPNEYIDPSRYDENVEVPKYLLVQIKEQLIHFKELVTK